MPDAFDVTLRTRLGGAGGGFPAWLAAVVQPFKVLLQYSLWTNPLSGLHGMVLSIDPAWDLDATRTRHLKPFLPSLSCKL